MKAQEDLVIYDDGRKVSIDGKYYILKKERPASTEEAVILPGKGVWIRPEKEIRKTTYPKDGKNYVAEDILYNASGKEIIRGEEIFEDKRQVAEIRLDFIGQNTFFAWAVGWRENTTFYVYRISDSKPEFLYKVLGGDCSFLVGGNRPKISKDGLLSVAYQNTGSYEIGGERYMVLRLRDNIIKEYAPRFKGEIYLLNNGRWLEATENRVDLYLWHHKEIKKLKSIDYESSAELLFQDDFLIIVRDMDKTKPRDKALNIFEKYTLDWLKMLLPDLASLSVVSLEPLISLGEEAFYLDPDFLSARHPVIRIKGVKRRDVISVETSPRAQYAVVETKQGTFVYKLSRKRTSIDGYSIQRLLNKQKIDPKHSFCFKRN